MPDTTEGLSTEASGPTQQQANAEIFAASFNEASAAVAEPAETALEKPVAQVKPAPAETKPAEEPEFPTELMTGETPEPVEEKDEELDAIQPSKKMGDESRANFDRLKGIAKTAKQEAARLAKELAAAKEKPAAAPDKGAEEAVKAANARIAELEATLEKANFTFTPKYQKIVAEGEQAIADAKGYLAGTEIPEGIIDAAARATGSKRTAILKEAGMDAETIASVAPYLAQFDRSERERVASLEGSKGWREQQAAQESAMAAAQKARERAEEDQVYNAIGEQVAKAFEPFQIIPGREKWNAQVETLKAEAKEFFNGEMPLEKMAEIAYYGVGAKVIHRMFHAQRAEVKALKQQVAKLTAAQPNGGDRLGDSLNGKVPTTPEELHAARAASFDAAFGR